MKSPKRIDKTMLDDSFRDEIDQKASIKHTHTESDIVDLDKYTKSEVDSKLEVKLDKTGTVSWEQVIGKPQLADDSWKTPVDSPADLPLEGNEHGDIRLTLSAEKYVFSWDSELNQWLLIGANDTNIDWETIQGKPSSFPPSSHSHTWTEVTGKPTVFPPSSHTHDERYYTEDEMDSKLANKSDEGHAHTWGEITGKPSTFPASSHTHDERYYTESEIDTKLATKSDSNHTHEWEEIQSKPSLFPPSVHTHTEADITNLDKYTKKETDDKLALKSDVTHTHADYSLNTHDHDGRYYQKSEITSLLSGKSDKTHTHSELHTHVNKSVLDTITQNDLDLLDSHEERLFNIENGYTEGHSHGNLQELNKITYSGAKESIDLIGIEEALSELGTKAETNHSHVWSEVIGKPTTFTPSSHNHNDLYYTESEVDTLLSEKASASTVNAHIVDSSIHVTTIEKTAIGTISGKADKSYVDTELAKKASSSTLSGHTGNSTIHVTQGDKDSWNRKADATGVKNNGMSGGTAFVIEETDTTKRPAIFLTNDLGRAGFFWYGSDYATYGGKFRIHLDKKSDVLFTNVEKILVDGQEVYHEGNLSIPDISNHTDDSTIHVTQSDKDNWNGKQDALGFTPVNKLGDEIDGKLSIGNRTSHVSTDEKERSLNLIDTNSVVRIWRYSSSGAGMEFINGTDADPKSLNNAWWDIALRGTGESSDMLFRSRIGGTSQVVLRLLTNGKFAMGNQTSENDSDDTVSTKKYVDNNKGTKIVVSPTEPTVNANDLWYKELS